LAAASIISTTHNTTILHRSTLRSDHVLRQHGLQNITEFIDVLVADIDRLAFSLLYKLYLLITKHIIELFEITKYDMCIPKLDRFLTIIDAKFIP
jgi:hypothetical protein